MRVNHLLLTNLSVNPQELLRLPIFIHMSRSGIYYKYHAIKKHVGRAKHLPLRVGDVADYLEEPVDRVGEWLGYKPEQKWVG